MNDQLCEVCEVHERTKETEGFKVCDACSTLLDQCSDLFEHDMFTVKYSMKHLGNVDDRKTTTHKGEIL